MKSDETNEVDVSGAAPVEPSPNPIGGKAATPASAATAATVLRGEAVECPGCVAEAGLANPNSVTPAFVYALGKIEMRLPSLAIEKELAQVIGRSDTAGATDREAVQRVLSERANRYLARRLCWVYSVEGIETYILHPRDPLDFDMLVGAVRSRPSTMDVDAIIGIRGGIAPPALCNGLALPLVFFDQIYSFDRDSLLGAIPTSDDDDKEDLSAAASELLDRVLQLADNAGATDEHRAINYLILRYQAIYKMVVEQYRLDNSLSEVRASQSPLSGARNIQEVVFAFTNRTTDVIERYMVRVDVSEEFPFLASKLSPYCDAVAH